MKFFWPFYSLILIFSAVSVGVYIWIFHPINTSDPKLSFSPLPSFLNLVANAQVTTLDIWNPQQQEVQNRKIAIPDLTAQSSLSYDISSNQLLFEKNAQQKLPMASLTKIMTAIVALEHPKQDDTYLVPSSAIVGEDSMGLDSGEILSLKELLYGLFLKSGNDTAEVYAANFPEGRTAFIDAMNKKAQALGLTDTHFTNPSGLEGDGDQHTTVKDLLVMTKYALENFSIIDKVGATVEQIIPQTATHKEYDLENETNLLTTYPGVKGLKTGYTPEAGLCLVTYLEYGNHKIIAIVLGSENRRSDMKELLDYSLKKLGITPPPHQ